MVGAEQDPRAAPGRRRIPLVHLVVLGSFALLVAPFLRPAHPDCAGRVTQALDRDEAATSAEVLRTCRRELARYTRESDATGWAEIQLGVGTLLAESGEHAQATDAHRQALLVFTRESNPRCWASIHYAIARLLLVQAKRTPAAASYRSALAELDPGSSEAELARRGLQETEAARGLGKADVRVLQGGLGSAQEWSDLLTTCRGT